MKKLLTLLFIVLLAAIVSINLGCSKTTSQTDTQSQQAPQTDDTSKQASQPQTDDQSQQATQSTSTSQPAADAPAKVTYTSDIAPLLSDECVRCHNPKGSVDSLPLDTYSSVVKYVKPGDPANSKLVKALDGGEMDGRLTNDQLTLLKNWIQQGASK